VVVETTVVCTVVLGDVDTSVEDGALATVWPSPTSGCENAIPISSVPIDLPTSRSTTYKTPPAATPIATAPASDFLVNPANN
jgi:hypothetical protein